MSLDPRLVKGVWDVLECEYWTSQGKRGPQIDNTGGDTSQHLAGDFCHHMFIVPIADISDMA